MAWTKGMKSPNPGGRPKGAGLVRELAQTYTEDSIKALAAMMKNKRTPPSVRVSAAQTLLDRGWGRAPQYLEVEDKGLRGVLEGMHHEKESDTEAWVKDLIKDSKSDNSEDKTH